MPRLRGRVKLDRSARPPLLDLLMGPTDAPGELTVDELEVAWEIHGDEIMGGYKGPPGTRPWAYWWFDLGEEQPRERWNEETHHMEDCGVETIRLAELGELTREELAALREEANEARLRIGTGHERLSGGGRQYGVSMDQQDVDLWEAVAAALPKKGRR